MKWFTIGPAWGDSIVCYINAINDPSFAENPNVIFYPAHRGNPEFFLSQGKIKNHKIIIWGDFVGAGMFRPWLHWAEPSKDAERVILDLANCPNDTIIYNHVINERGEIKRKLPFLSVNDHAQQLVNLDGIPEKYILLQPYSLNSSGIERHWPHWKELVTFCDLLPYTVVLVGSERWHTDCKNIINLSGLLPDMSSVFSLAQKALFTITTTNSLPLFCMCNKLPCLMVNNTILSYQPKLIWRKYLNTSARGMMNEVNDPFYKVKDSVISMLALYGN